MARGPKAAKARASEIRALQAVLWKGARLRRILCWGTRGKGIHAVNVPESLLWSLIHIESYVCPYHTPDDPAHHGDMLNRRSRLFNLEEDT